MKKRKNKLIDKSTGINLYLQSKKDQSYDWSFFICII